MIVLLNASANPL